MVILASSRDIEIVFLANSDNVSAPYRANIHLHCPRQLRQSKVLFFAMAVVNLLWSDKSCSRNFVTGHIYCSCWGHWRQTRRNEERTLGAVAIKWPIAAGKQRRIDTDRQTRIAAIICSTYRSQLDILRYIYTSCAAVLSKYFRFFDLLEVIRPAAF